MSRLNFLRLAATFLETSVSRTTRHLRACLASESMQLAAAHKLRKRDARRWAQRHSRAHSGPAAAVRRGAAALPCAAARMRTA